MKNDKKKIAGMKKALKKSGNENAEPFQVYTTIYMPKI